MQTTFLFLLRTVPSIFLVLLRTDIFLEEEDILLMLFSNRPAI